MPTALVTGASRGVGKGVAISLAAAGYTVYATGRITRASKRREPFLPEFLNSIFW